MATTILGKVSVTPKGAWSSASAYDKLDIVYNNGSSYISLQDVPTGVAISNASYWLCIAEKGDKGDKGDTGATGATGATGNGIQDVYLTGTSGNVDTYTILYTDGTTDEFTVTNGSVTSVNGRTGAVTGLAEIDGYYENLSSGSSDQLISTIYAEDSVPYVFRTSGGSADIGDREFDEIVGGTIAWNQLIRSNASDWTFGDSTGTGSNGTATFTATARYGYVRPYKYNIYANHVYLWSVDVKGTQEHEASVNFGSTGGTVAFTMSTDWQTIFKIAEIPSDSTQYFPRIADRRTSNWTAITVKNVMGFDLTQMFGPTIADYVLSLGDDGAYAWFKKLFPKPYYAYNTGSLISVNASAHETTGFNQWDETWDSGYWDVTTGAWTPIANRFASKTHVKVLPSTTYYAKTPSVGLWILQYDADKNYLGTSLAIFKTNATFTTDARCQYINFYAPVGYSTYNNDICINLSWSGYRNGEYEAYVKHTYPLDSSLTLRGIPKLDADNSLYYDGDTYEADGTVTRKYGVVDLGTLTWSALALSWGTVFTSDVISDIEPSANSSSLANAISGKYEQVNYAGLQGADRSFNVIWKSSSAAGKLYVHDSAYSDATAFTNAVSGVYLVYELATPTTESADSFVSPQIVDDFGTERYVVSEQNGVALPVGHNTRYTQNLRDKIQHLPDLASADGNYIITQSGTQMSLTAYTVPPIPSASGEDGTYVLKATISGGTVSYTWVAE